MRQLPAYLLTRKLDPRLVTILVVFGIGFGGVFLLSLFVGTPHAKAVVWKNLPLGLLICCVLICPMYLSDRAYQVGWDEEGIFARLGGWRFEALFSREDKVARDFGRPRGPLGWLTRPPVSFMRYGDIISIGLPAASNGRPERPTIYINGRANPPGLYHNLIGIDLDSFTRQSVLQLMEVLRSKRPDIVPQGWAKQLSKRR